MTETETGTDRPPIAGRPLCRPRDPRRPGPPTRRTPAVYWEAGRAATPNNVVQAVARAQAADQFGHLTPADAEPAALERLAELMHGLDIRGRHLWLEWRDVPACPAAVANFEAVWSEVFPRGRCWHEGLNLDGPSGGTGGHAYLRAPRDRRSGTECE